MAATKSLTCSALLLRQMRRALSVSTHHKIFDADEAHKFFVSQIGDRCLPKVSIEGNMAFGGR